MQALYELADRRPVPTIDIPSIPEPVADIVVGSGLVNRSWVVMITVTGRLYALGNIFGLYTLDNNLTPWPLPPPPSPVRMVFPTYRPALVTEDGRVYTYRYQAPYDPYQLLTQWPDFYAAGGNDAALWFITEDGVLHVDRRMEQQGGLDYSDGVMERLHFHAPRPLISATVTSQYVAALTVDGDVYVQRLSYVRLNHRTNNLEFALLWEVLGPNVITMRAPGGGIAVRLTERLDLPPVRAFGHDVASRSVTVVTEDGRRLRLASVSAHLRGNVIEDFDTQPVRYSIATEIGNILLLESGELLLNVGSVSGHDWATSTGQQPGPVRQVGYSKGYVLVVLEDGRVFHSRAPYRHDLWQWDPETAPPGPGFQQLL